jgi:D-alanyl-D-alanine carboxypeptidase (penicillin-binding protein 5/6)
MGCAMVWSRWVAVCLIWCVATPAHVSAAQTLPELELNAKAAILMEAQSGEILFARNETTPYQPASMTKMMTEYIILDEVRAGRLSWDTQLMTSKAAADAIGSGQLLAEGKTYAAKEVFALLSVYSGNDASIAFAEHIAGSEEQFAEKMNAMARTIGMSGASRFINSTGLSRKDMGAYAPKESTGETLLTASDSALLARRIVLDHPEVLETTKLPFFVFEKKHKMINWNWMVEANKSNVNLRQYAYEGLDGLKTGHTKDAGYCFTGTAIRDGMRLISVIIGADSMANRFRETRRLLDFGFAHFAPRIVLAAKSVVPDVQTVFVRNALKQNVPVVAGDGVRMIVPKEMTKPPEITVALIAADQLQAPLRAEAKVGTITVRIGAQVQEVPLIVAEDVVEAGFWRSLWRGVGQFFGRIVQGLMDLF